MRASRIIGCNPWELAEQPEFWQDWAFRYSDLEYKISEGLAKVQEQRGEHASNEYE